MTSPTELEQLSNMFMEMARRAAQNSTCSRRQVGAVLVNKLQIPVRLGWNIENPRTLRCNQGDCPRGRKSYEEKPAFSEYSDCVATHAEMWVIQGYEGHGEEFTVYVTCKPCPDCQEVLDRYKFFVNYPEET